jgi:hypothetical protein
MTVEQQARDLLERIGVDDAQSFSSGDLVELANLIDGKPKFTAEELEAIEDAQHWTWVFGAPRCAALKSAAAKVRALLPPQP